ncbi:hypothetical protein BJ165DRAFT_1329000, partial [Panaeolus papilionaceus]
SYTSTTSIYILDISITTQHSTSAATKLSSFLIISADSQDKSQDEYPTNNLETIAHILKQVQKHTSISFSFSPGPSPTEPILDTSLTLLPFSFLLLPPTSRVPGETAINLTEARSSGALSQKQLLTIDLRLGQMFGELHSNLQNDWFGLPLPGGKEPSEPSYSWQETFTLLLETVIEDLEKSTAPLEIPYTLVRSLLSRAIGSFLFDDAEVPSLTLFTQSEDDVYVLLSLGENNSSSLHITLVPNLTRALFGDPLLESLFFSPGPSDAFWEGYRGAGGEPLVVIPRQKTKRLWYDLFLGLVALRE